MRTLHADVITLIEAGGGSVAWLLEIELAGVTLRYTTWDAELTYGGQSYLPRAFEPGDIEQSASRANGELSVSIDDVDGGTLRAAAIQNLMRGRPVWLRWLMIDGNGDIAGADAGVETLFCGRIKNPALDGKTVSFSVESWLSMNRLAPVEMFGPACPNIFRGDLCGFTSGVTELTGQTADAGSTTTTVEDNARHLARIGLTEPQNHWIGGWLVFTTGDAAGKKRMIKSVAHDGTIYLSHPLPAAPAEGDEYTISQGCDKTYKTCSEKYSNTANFRGFVSMQELAKRA